MERHSIAHNSFFVKAHGLWTQDWLLLTAGDFHAGQFNTMTVSWGSLGTIWHKPFVQVVVRPVRYTYEFIEKYDTFTLCGFSKQYRKALQLLGTISGKDRDKIAEAGLTPVAASHVAAPGFAEAELIVECQKIYWDDFEPRQFLDPAIERNYPLKNYHRIYYGEVVAISGEESYSC